MKKKEKPEGFEASMANAEINRRAAEEMQMLDIHQAFAEQQAMTPKKINEEVIRKAHETLMKYKEGKAHLESKIIANEQFWKLRQWGMYNYNVKDEEEAKKDFEPATAWLFSCINSRHADVMDSYPTCNFLARQEDDKVEAKLLSEIVPVILEQNRYEETYSDVAWYALKHGGKVEKIAWDKSKYNGLGDISINKVDFMNLFWEPGIVNIQDSENVFNTELVSNNIIEGMYPQTVGRLGQTNITTAKYIYDDHVSTENKSVVVDWYYHTVVKGKKVLQYCKFVDDIVLYATENDTEIPTRKEIDPETKLPIFVPTGPSVAERGLYDHGLYPFVTMPLYPIEGSICGFGLTDIGRDAQMQIDLLNKAITDNAVAGSRPRHFIKDTGGVNEKEYCDLTKDLVHVSGSIDDNNIRPIDTKPLDSIYVNVLTNKIDELKFVTSNQDVANGSAPSGVTAASAIAALQETSGKASRDANKAFHRAFRDVCYQIIELIRQFYDTPRVFRIAPDSQGEEYVMFSNEGLKPQPQIVAGQDLGLRRPEFDIEVTSEKASPYKKMEQNELALSFYNQGFFNPQMADQALSCLEMMDFQHKEDVMQRIRMNGTLQQKLLQMEQLAMKLAQKYEPETADAIAQMVLEENGQPVPQGGEVSIGDENEPTHVEKARENARRSTQVE